MADCPLPPPDLFVFTKAYIKDRWHNLEEWEEDEWSSSLELQAQEEFVEVHGLGNSKEENGLDNEVLEEEVLDEDAQREKDLITEMEALGLPTTFTSSSKFVEPRAKRKSSKSSNVTPLTKRFTERGALTSELLSTKAKNCVADISGKVSRRRRTRVGYRNQEPEQKSSEVSLFHGTLEESEGLEFVSDFVQKIWDHEYNCFYYYDGRTGESTWEAPEGLAPDLYEGTEWNNVTIVEGGTNAVPKILEDSSDNELSSLKLFAAEAEVHHVEQTPECEEVDWKDVISSLEVTKTGEESDEDWPLLKIETICTTVSEKYAPFTSPHGSKCGENAPPDIPDQVLPGKKLSKSKYWRQRYLFFSKFDEGIQLDEEGLYSVTPEAIARHHAMRCRPGVVLDGFTGVGGNAIQFALMGHTVIAVDIDPEKIKFARQNAKVYDVEHLIDFIEGDFYELAPTLQADTVFLSPPWGGPEYIKHGEYDLEMLQPKDGYTLFKAALAIASNVALFLPRNVSRHQLARLFHMSDPPTRCEVENNYLNGHLKAVTAYYGDFAPGDDET